MTNRTTEIPTGVPMLLLPPSEGKAFDEPDSNDSGWDPSDGTFGALELQRLAVAEALSAAGGGSEKLLGVGGKHLLRAQAANSMLIGAPTMPAWRRYTGVVWDHLDPASLGAVARRRIVVVSGLLGVVRADDPIPDYRLRMSVNLAPMGKLSTWWRDDVTAALQRAAKGKVIVDMLPQEHRAAWTTENLPRGRRGVTVSLVDPTGKPGGHFAKAAKGELARAILSDGIDVLQSWRHERFELIVTPLT
ncbi:MAG: peroxide stress protein YaaA [Ilumatobacteraceae bacterium]|nr:peroxide stress protein YaaA [Ilumatobacteraceae bacterium]